MTRPRGDPGASALDYRRAVGNFGRDRNWSLLVLLASALTTVSATFAGVNAPLALVTFIALNTLAGIPMMRKACPRCGKPLMMREYGRVFAYLPWAAKSCGRCGLGGQP